MIKSKRKSFVKMVKAIKNNDIDTLQQMADGGFIPNNLVIAAKSTNDRTEVYELMISSVKRTRLHYEELPVNLVEQTDGGLIASAVDKFTDLDCYFQGKLHVDANIEARFEENILRAAGEDNVDLGMFLNDVYNRLSSFVKGNRTNIVKSGLETILVRLNNIENICKHIVTQDNVNVSNAGPISTTSNESTADTTVSFETITELLNSFDFEGYQHEDIYPLYKEVIERIAEVHKKVFDYYIMETVSDSVAGQLEVYMKYIVEYGEQTQSFAVAYRDEEQQTAEFLEIVCGLYS